MLENKYSVQKSNYTFNHMYDVSEFSKDLVVNIYFPLLISCVIVRINANRRICLCCEW